MSDLLFGIVIRAIDRTGAAVRSSTNNFAALNKGVTRYQKSMQTAANVRQAAEGVDRFAAGARRALTGPVSVAEEFGAAMAGVKAVTAGAETAEGFAALTAQAKELGSTTRYTAIQSAKAMHFLGMAGFDVQRSMTAMPSVLQLATAGQTDLARSADIASNILGAFGMEASEFTRVGDILTNTFTSSNVTLDMLAESMKYTAPVAKDLGISIEETAALTGLLGDIGIQGSMAGTSLRAISQRLAAPMRMGAKAVKGIGLEVMDADKNFRGLSVVLDDLNEKLAGKGSSERAKILKMIFGEEAATAASALLGKAGGRIQEFTAANENAAGKMAEVSGVMDATSKGATVRMASAFEGLNLAIGEQALEPLDVLKEKVTENAAALTGWAVEHPRATKAAVITVGAVALLATALAGLLFTISAITSAVGFGALIFGIKKTGVELVAAAVKGVAKFTWSMVRMAAVAIGRGVYSLGQMAVSLVRMGVTAVVTAIPAIISATVAFYGMAVATLAATWPILAVIGAIALVAAGAYLLVKHWEPIKKWFAGLWETIKGIFDKSIAWILEKVDKLSEATSGILEKAAPLAGAIAGVLFPGAGPVVAGLLGGADGVERSKAAPLGAPRETLGFASTVESRVGGTLRIAVEDDRVAVKELQSDGGMDIDVDTGVAWVAP